MAYTTDLTAPQFEVLDRLLPKSKTGNSVISRHRIVNAIFYQLKNGCQWRDLPTDFPNRQDRPIPSARRWQLDGTWEAVLAALAETERTGVKKTGSQVC